MILSCPLPPRAIGWAADIKSLAILPSTVAEIRNGNMEFAVLANLTETSLINNPRLCRVGKH
jgi:hypothetical protein